MASKIKEVIDQAFARHEEALVRCRVELSEKILLVAEILLTAFEKGGKLLLCGNGGSAADAQHIAAELTGRFLKDRKALPAIALTTDTSALTAIGNDLGYNLVFSRQVEALARRGDVVIGISTSGQSTNILRAMEEAKNAGCTTVALTGRDGGKLAQCCDFAIVVPAYATPQIQEMHITIGHIICELVENGPVRRQTDLLT